MENPRYLPLLALLHPPPSGRFLPGLTRYDIVQMMANDYPQHLRDEVHAAVEVDPERVIHVISLILFRRYSSDAPSNPSEEGSAVGLVAGPEDIGDAATADSLQQRFCFLSTSFMDDDGTLDDDHTSSATSFTSPSPVAGPSRGPHLMPPVTARGSFSKERAPNDVFYPAPSNRALGSSPTPSRPTTMLMPALVWVLGLDRRAVLHTLQTDPRCLMLLPQVFPPCPFSEEVVQTQANVHIVASYVRSLERMYPAYTKRDILYHLRFAPLTILPFIPHIAQLPYDISALLQKLSGLPPTRVGKSPAQPGTSGGIDALTESTPGYYVTFDDGTFPSHPPSTTATCNPSASRSLPCLIESTAGSNTTQCNVDETMYPQLTEHERSVGAIARRLDHFRATYFPEQNDLNEGTATSSPAFRPASHDPREPHNDPAAEFASIDLEMVDGETGASIDEVISADGSIGEPDLYDPELPSYAHTLNSNDGTFAVGPDPQGHDIDSFLSAGNFIAFRRNDDTYEIHLKFSRLMVRLTAFGFLLGAASFLGLRALALTPLGALTGGFHLAVAMLLVL